ncbi:hypothetical protein GCM10027049_08010 [Mucilaginibacter puniceus]
MFEMLQIRLLGNQPYADIKKETLERIIIREFGSKADEVKEKLQRVLSDSPKGKRRISAAIIKLANSDINAIDGLIDVSNYDYRDIISRAEYPKACELDFDDFEELSKRQMKQIYLSDWKQYSNWVNGI